MITAFAIGKNAVRVSFGLGILSLLAVIASYLALTDISHGEGGVAEWRALEVSFVIFALFHASALTTLWRLLPDR
jgi:hypothetical protein